jgi:hypothetical protein
VDPLVPLLRTLNQRQVRYVMIGVGAVNLWAHSGGVVFKTDDRDLFLPPEPDNLLRAWTACEEVGLELSVGPEPLDRPRDLWMAQRIVERRALTRATGPTGLLVDLSLLMQGFEFDAVWNERRVFRVDDADVPTARLLHIVTSKHAAGRPKDQLFLSTHKDALEQLLKKSE